MFRTPGNQSDLVTQDQLLERFGGRITAKKFGELRRKKLIPVIRLGHRTLLYSESAVLRAIKKLTVREVES